MIALLKKDSFSWSKEAKLAFQQLKAAMVRPPVLALPNFDKPFVIECDALGKGLGTVLMQRGRPIAFHSQALKGKNLALSTYEELLALVIAIKRWRAYLVGRPFIVKIDQQSLKYLLEQSLKYLLEQKIGTPTQQKWFAKLLGYAFVVYYKKGKDNLVADALSSKVEFEDILAPDVLVVKAEPKVFPFEDGLESQEGVLCMISFPSPAWLADLKSSHATD